MRTAKQMLDEQFLEMRWRCLSLAADLDRLQRAAGADAIGIGPLNHDHRLQKLKQAFEILMTDSANRAEQIQLLFSDQTPLPEYSK